MNAITSGPMGRDWDDPALEPTPLDVAPGGNAARNDAIPLRTNDKRGPGRPNLTLLDRSSVNDPWVDMLESARFVEKPRLLYATVLKRGADISLAILLIILFAVPMAAIACWIACDSRGGVFYTQRRLGYGRREFTMYKFRSMRRDADALIESDPHLVELYSSTWKIPDDPRVTRCGRLLRRFSLDELPQLLNVLRGDMSLVGPRPYMARELRDEFGQHANLITSVKPGMTGLWQVSGRSKLTPSDRIRLDEQYIQELHLVNDVRILGRTIMAVIRSNGAY